MRGFLNRLGRPVALVTILVVPFSSTYRSPTAELENNLELRTWLDHQVFFESEPIHAVFQLVNEGPDTVWVEPFGLVLLTLKADITTADGVTVPRSLYVADYVAGPGWRGVSVRPGESLYDFMVLQHHWGWSEPALRDLYSSHHMTTGAYVLRARFDVNLRSSHARRPAFVEAEKVRFVIRPRTGGEDSLFTNVQRLARMPWDSLERPNFLAALLQYAGERVAQDVQDPFLPLLLSQMVGTARAVGYPPDSVTIDSLNALRLVVGQNRRFEPAGVIAVAPIRYERPAITSERSSSARGVVGWGCPTSDLTGPLAKVTGRASEGL